jgi:tetratricopeptide (TPR) repeat protein
MNVAAADLRRAEALIEINRLDDAAQMLGVFLATNPDSFLAWALLARCHGLQGRHHEMVGAAQRACHLEPDNELGHRLLARALLNLKRPAEAKAVAAESVRLAPRSWRTHLALGGAALANKDLRLAWRCGAEARSLAPAEANTHAFCADVLQAMADSRAARTNYREALRLDPDHHGARHNLAVLEYYRGRLVVAAEGFGAAVAGAPMVDEYARNAQLAARAVLWRLTDWALPVLLICWSVSMTAGPRASMIALPVLVLGYAMLVRWILFATPPTIRAEMRRRITKPTFGLAVVGIAALLLASVGVSYLAPQTVGGLLSIPGLLFLVVILFRLRNRISRWLYFLVRRVYYRLGRKPAS